jgi:hypothetical protein
MTIYPRLERDEIDRLSARFPGGVIENIKDIAAGHENSKTCRQMDLIADQVHQMPADDFCDAISA